MFGLERAFQRKHLSQECTCLGAPKPAELREKGRTAQMLFERLKPQSQDLMAYVRQLQLFAFVALAAAFLWLTSPLDFESFVPPQVLFSERDDPVFARANADDADWQEVSIYQIRGIDGVAWLRWRNPDLPEQTNVPLAIHTSGPFSAEFFWNDILIGSKGTVGENAESETAGPIDAVVAIPPELVEAEGNVLAIRLSSERAGYRPAVILQNLVIGPYASDARRSLRYYAPTVLLSGLLLALAVVIGIITRLGNDRRALWVAVAISGLIFAMLAEVSRSLISYPYDWHQPRQAATMVGLIIFGASLIRFATLRWPDKETLQGWLGPLWLCGGISIGLGLALTNPGYDSRSVVVTMTLVITVIFWLVRESVRNDRNAIGFALGLSLLPVYAFFETGDFLDRGVYALTVVLFGFVLVRQRSLLWQPRTRSTKREVLSVISSGETLFVPVAQIAFLTAAGNYTEVHKSDGTWVLDHRGLRRVLEDLPERFIRVHRSHAIDLERASSIRSAAGSRYWLTLDEGTELPVSRNQVKELRARMKSSRSDSES